MSMLRMLVLSLCALGAVAQEPSVAEKVPSGKAPPEIDAALRSRINTFYQAHVDAKFRVADQVVAEESKDLFFASTKPRYKAYKITKIDYSEDFTKADALVACDADWSTRGQVMPVTIPMNSHWKLIDGQWFWYVVPLKEVGTPFGTMHFDSPPRAPGEAAPAPALPGDPMVIARQILSQVKIDKTEVELSSYKPAQDQVVLTNGMLGVITLRSEFDGAFPGLTAKLNKTQVGPGETATLTISCQPKDKAAKPTLTARIYVEPTNQVFSVRVTFAVPEAIQRLIDQSAGKKPVDRP